MNLDEFKLATNKQLKVYGDTIPMESVFDSNGNTLTYRDSYGYWRESTYDSNGNPLTYKESNGYWRERTYDTNNNQLTLKSSTGYWCERTYNTNGKVLTYKNSDGANEIILHIGTRYDLWYDIDSHKYVAGCQKLTYKECLAYYKLNKDEHDDAELFMNIIKEHHKSIDKI